MTSGTAQNGRQRFFKRKQLTFLYRYTILISVTITIIDKTVSNVKEVKARGAVVMGVTTEEHEHMDDVADYTVKIPATHEMLLPSLTVIPLQLFGYYVASLKGCDIDKPRNLAKSVTVE